MEPERINLRIGVWLHSQTDSSHLLQGVHPEVAQLPVGAEHLVVGPLRRPHRVVHEEAHRHGPDAARNWSDESRALRRGRKVDVADEPISGLLALVGDGVDAAVDDDGSLLDPLARHELCPAHGDDEYVCSAHDALQIPGLGVADGDGGVVPLEQLRHWRAHQLAPADHDGVGALQVDPAPLDELHAAGGSAGGEAGGQVTRRHLPLVDGAEAVDVLGGEHAVSHGVGVDARIVRVERKLNDDPVNVGVVVERVNLLQQLGLGYGPVVISIMAPIKLVSHFSELPWQIEVLGADADLSSRLHLHVDVDVGVLPAAHLDDGQAGSEAGGHGRHLRLERLPHGRRSVLARDQLGGHR